MIRCHITFTGYVQGVGFDIVPATQLTCMAVPDG